MAEVRVGVLFRPESPPEDLRETVIAADEAPGLLIAALSR
jgi:hypothetical protein